MERDLNKVTVACWLVGAGTAAVCCVMAIISADLFAALGWFVAVVASSGAALSSRTLWLSRRYSSSAAIDANIDANRAEFSIVWDSAVAWLAVHGSDVVPGPLLQDAERANPWRKYDDWKEQAP